MFNDKRSKKIIVIAHCIINQNAKSDGTASFAGTINEVLELLNSLDIGIIQMPCPELHCLGLDRGDITGNLRPAIEENSRIRKVMTQENAIEKMKILIQATVYQIEEYIKNGFTVKGIIGINRSPSCGVETTSKEDKEIEGQGVFVEELQKELLNKGFDIDFIGIKTFEPQKAISAIRNLLN